MYLNLTCDVKLMLCFCTAVDCVMFEQGKVPKKGAVTLHITTL